MAENGGAPSRKALVTAGASIAALSSAAAGATSSHAIALHMTEHIGLLLVAPILLALGCPLSGRWRARARTHWLGALAVTWLLHSAVTVAWHLPAPFDAAERSAPVHLLEHASMLAAGCAFWAHLFAKRDAGAVLAPLLFVASLPGTALGVTMMLSTVSWYASAPGALADQQLGGVVMLAVGGAIYAVVALAGFRRWFATLPQQPALAR